MDEEEFVKTSQSKFNIKKCKDYIHQLFIDTGIEKVNFIKRITYTLENSKIYKEIHFVSEESFPLKNKNLVDSMNEQLNKSELMDHELMRYFKPESNIRVGQKIEGIPNIEKLNGDTEISFQKLEKGKVCLIYIWSIYKSICKKQLLILNQLWEKKNNWERYVKFCSFNTDSNREYAIKLIKSLGINKIEHFYINQNKRPDHPAFDVIETYGLPVCIFINNDNIVEVIGSLFEIDLENKIKSLLEREFATSTTTNFIKSVNDTVEKHKIKKIFHKLDDCEFLELYAPHLANAKLVVKKIYSSGLGNKLDYTYSSQLDYSCHPDDDQFITDLFGTEEWNKLIVFKNFISTYEIEYGEYCFNCYKQLGCTKTQFHCVSCKMYLCTTCGEEVTSIENFDKIHNHFLYFLHKNTKQFMKFILSLNNDNFYELDFKYFQDNKTTKYINENRFHYNVKCDGCLVFPIKTTRWKCCNCLFKNICDSCMKILFTEQAPYYEEILYNIRLNNCNPLEHVFMKIIFDIFSY